jgi:hypothetical protein
MYRAMSVGCPRDWSKIACSERSGKPLYHGISPLQDSNARRKQAARCCETCFPVVNLLWLLRIFRLYPDMPVA